MRRSIGPMANTARFLPDRPAGPLHPLPSWTLAALLAATVLASALFVVFPNLDTTISSWFYVDGRGFPAETNALLNTIRNVGRNTTRIIGLGVFALVLATLLAPRRIPIAPRATLFLTLTLLVGPLILVDFTMKEVWGRARPRDVVDFGGAFDFSRAWEMVRNCSGNCSFVSGEASASFWLIALAFVAPPRWRLPVGLATALFALVMSLNRVAFGGHFMSDVVLAWLLTFLVIALVHRIVAAPDGPFTDARLKRAVVRFGRPLRRGLHAVLRLATGRRPRPLADRDRLP